MHFAFLWIPFSRLKIQTGTYSPFRLVLSEKREKAVLQKKKEKRKIFNKSESPSPPLISNEKKKAQSVRGPWPVYPRQARIRGIEGDVILKIHIDNGGLPFLVEVADSSGYSILDQAAIKGVRQWRFDPAGKKRVGTPFWIKKRFSFRLR